MSHRPEELLIAVIAGLLEGTEHVAVGAASPIPAAAALLARERSAGNLRVSLLGGRETGFTDGGRELFDCAGQGRIDAFFLGGVQIDGSANINLVGTGAYPRGDVRFAGSFGSAYLSFLVPRVILFQPDHSLRTLVSRVDFISAPGVGPAGVYRPGGPIALVTGRCVFGFDRDAARFRLSSVHPGHTVEDVRDNTGFEFDLAERVPPTAVPDEDTLALIRGPVGRVIAETYPLFAARVLGLAG